MKKLNFHTSRLIIIIAFLVAIMSISDSCTKSSMDNMNSTGGSGDGTGGPGTNEVWIKGMAFTPASITVTAGTTIKWTNKDAITHTVTSNTGVFDSQNVNAGGTYSYTFATVGTYPYHCTIHPSMTGSVVVTAAVGMGY